MNSQTISLPSPSVQDRIFDAANNLYDDAGRQSYPTVDAVRKLAKVNMNDASIGMRAWRRLQSTQITPVAAIIPESLQRASSATLTSLWTEAVELANGTLRAAQASWDVERSESEALRAQIATAYETLSAELEEALSHHQQLQHLNEEQHQEISRLRETIGEQNRALHSAQTSAANAETRATEIERRAADLRAELDYAHGALASAQTELDQQRQRHHAEASDLRKELSNILQRSDAREYALETTLGELRHETRQLQEKIQTMTAHESPPRPKKSPTKLVTNNSTE